MEILSIHYHDGQQTLIGKLFFEKGMNSPLPAVILFPAFEGHSEFIFDYAKNIAKNGYAAFVADMYGDGMVSHQLEKCIELFMPFGNDRALTRRRALLAYETIANHHQVDKTRISVMGFCFGGMCALEVARSGADLKSCITLHGVLSKSELPTHPIKGSVLVLHGYEDPQVPPTSLPAFADEMKTAHVTDWTVTYFGTAQHSFTDTKTGTFDSVKEKAMGRAYHPIAAQRSLRYVVDFLNEML